MKSRNEMNSEYMWDFTHIFKSDKDWEEALEASRNDVAVLAGFEGKIGSDADTFRNAIKTSYRVFERFSKVSVYAFLKKTADGGDTTAQEMVSKAQSVGVKLSTAFAYAEPEILAIDEGTLAQYMDSDEMKTYRHYIEDMTRGKKHTLDAEREKLIARLGEASSAPYEIYSTFCNVELTFPKIKNDKGELVELTNGNYGAFRESKNREVRENAFTAYLGEYKKYNNTFASIYSSSVKIDHFYSEIRDFSSACEAGLFGSNVPTSVYDNLCKAVCAKLPSMKKYIGLRKKVLGLDKIDMFDLYIPMVDEVNYSVPYEDAKTLVREALKPLGDDYLKMLDRAFNENWIDVYENKGKRSGAFSCGVYGVHPYVLLNYTDTLGDAYTLAHELGHAMHSYYSDNTQDYANHGYRILVAEVASTVNEVLLTMYLLKKETDEKRRAFVVNRFLEGFRTTVFRQTLFAEFERETHNMCENGVPLTAAALNDLYLGLLKKYYDGAEINEIMAYEWSYIPHFYTPFYVYQYATGFCSAVAIAKHIIENNDNSGYLKFLTLGGSDYPLSELKVAGVDLTDSHTVDNALELFDKMIDELDALLIK